MARKRVKSNRPTVGPSHREIGRLVEKLARDLEDMAFGVRRVLNHDRTLRRLIVPPTVKGRPPVGKAKLIGGLSTTGR